MFYDRSRCRHYAESVRGLPQVFDPARRPWIRAALCTCGRTRNQPFCDGACGVNGGPSDGTRDQAETPQES